MRITIQALIEGVEGREPRAETIGVVDRDADGAPASGLGLFLRETHALLRQLQAVVAGDHVDLRAFAGDRHRRVADLDARQAPAKAAAVKL